MKRILVFLLLLSVVLLTGVTRPKAEDPAPDAAERPFPPGNLGQIVALGKELVDHTAEHPLSKEYVGNSLACSSCHLASGTDPQAASFLSVATAYPAWSQREKRVITLEDRILNCFMRSMNGIRPANGSEVPVAIATYITWLSEGEALKMNGENSLGPRHIRPLTLNTDKADAKRGAALYTEHCADCHGDDGLGTDDGPAVWGDDSYNAGAGLARIDKLASWLKVAMPLDDPHLTEQESLDIAAYVNSHPRPKFVLKDHLAK